MIHFLLKGNVLNILKWFELEGLVADVGRHKGILLLASNDTFVSDCGESIPQAEEMSWAFLITFPGAKLVAHNEFY